MAGLGRKVFVPLEFLNAADVNGYLMDQSVMVFASAAERSTEVTSPSAGMHSYRADGTVVEVYNGSAWVSANSVGGSVSASLVAGTLTASINASNVINTLTSSTATSYTYLSTDQGRVLRFTAAGTTTTTVGTATALTAGQRIDVLADGAALIVAAGSGVTLGGAGTAGTAYELTKYAAASILCVGSNAYRIIGNVEAI